MPEGDTIHKLAAAIAPVLEGRELTAATLEGQLVRAFVGREVDDVFALGKHLFVVVGVDALRTHLGMHGSWHRYAPGEAWQKPRWRASAVLETADRVLVCFDAKEAEVLDRRGPRYRHLVRRLGPDVLGASFDRADAVRRARALLGNAAPLCDVLLDQRVASGIGNVYKSELLFLGRRHPLAALGAMPDGELVALFDRARALLERNLGPGPRRTRAMRGGPARAETVADDSSLWVYGRVGAPCVVCDTVITHARLGRGRRSTYWCARCQPAG